MLVEDELKRQIQDLKARIIDIGERVERKDKLLQIPNVIRRFNEEWEIYLDPIIPKRLQLVIDGLRVRLTNTKLDQVANAQHATDASILTFGTTIGLKSPQGAFDKLGRNMVQLAGLMQLSETNRVAASLECESGDIATELIRQEAMMSYYYDLCSEFRGHEKQEALILRVKSLLGDLDEEEQAVFNLFTYGDDNTIIRFITRAKAQGKLMTEEQDRLKKSISQLQSQIDGPEIFRRELRENAKLITLSTLIILAWLLLFSLPFIISICS